MNMFSRPIAAVGVFLCLALSACGDPEPTQRKEFIEFLQTRILDKKGAHVPQLSGNQKEAFGPYVKDYAIISDFATNPDRERYNSTMKKLSSIRSLGELMARREDIVAFQNLIAENRGGDEQRFTTAEAAKAQLKQPDDLKAVFDKAYQRDVIEVAERGRRGAQVLGDFTAAALRVSDFIATHKDGVEVTGSMITAKDQKTLSALQPLLNDFNVKSQAVLELDRAMRALRIND